MNNYRNLSDEELVFLSKKGDGVATEELIYRYKNAVKSKARNFFLAGGDTEDLLQEGMIGLYYAIKSYNGESTFKNFAFLCIKRQLINAIKRAACDKHRPLNEYETLTGESGYEFKLPSQASPEEIFIWDEDLNFLSSRIKDELSSLEFVILEEYLKGKSYSEIAKKTGKEIKSVDNAIQRIRKKVMMIKAGK